MLRGVDLRVAPGERVALMGRNGAGKSTLLRHLGGLQQPTRGRVEAAGRVALLLQNPDDYLLHERVGDEAPAEALAAVGLAALGDRHPRDLSGGERQRLALAIVLDGRRPARRRLPRRADARHGPRREGRRSPTASRALAASGAAVLVATHDAEFAAAFAERVVLLADGRPIADAPAPRSSPAAGTSRPRPRGSSARADRPRQGGRAHPPRAMTMEVTPMSWELASFALLVLALAAGFAWYERTHPSSQVLALVATLAALAALGRIAFAPLPNVKPTTDIVLLAGFALGGAPGLRRRRGRRAGVEPRSSGRGRGRRGRWRPGGSSACSAPALGAATGRRARARAARARLRRRRARSSARSWTSRRG